MLGSIYLFLNDNFTEENIGVKKKGKNKITKILNCAKSTVSYNCSSGEKKEDKKRSIRHSTKQGALYKKLQGFCYNYGKKDLKRKHYPMLNMGEVTKLIGKKPICYLTGEYIDLKDMKNYSLDHIVPMSKGGKSTLDNLGLTTKQANQAKSDLTKEEFLALCLRVVKHNGYRVRKG
jgi:hypothetical protein